MLFLFLLKKIKNKNTPTKPALLNWSKFSVVTVNYRGTKDRQRRTERHVHSWGTETDKRSASKLTSSQLFVNEFFHKQVKT